GLVDRHPLLNRGEVGVAVSCPDHRVGPLKGTPGEGELSEDPPADGLLPHPLLPVLPRPRALRLGDVPDFEDVGLAHHLDEFAAVLMGCDGVSADLLARLLLEAGGAMPAAGVGPERVAEPAV